MARIVPLLLFVCAIGCTKKPPILGDYEGTLDFKVHAGKVELQKHFTGVEVTIKPLVKSTATGKQTESDVEVAIDLEGGPFKGKCSTTGLLTGAHNESAMVDNVPKQTCAMRLDDWSNDAVELSPFFEVIGKNEVKGSDTRSIEAPDGHLFVSLDYKGARK